MPAPEVDIWSVWDRIACPVLVTRGAESKILSRSTAKEMTARGPCGTLIEYPGTGHTPSLMVDDQIAAVVDWIRH